MTTPNLSSSDTAMGGNRRFDRATEKFRDLGSGVKDFANRGMSSMSDSAHAAQRHLEQYASATGRYVAEQPLKSAVIAAAVGAAVAGLILALRHNRHSRY